MAVRDDFSAGEVLAAADLNDTFASKLPYSYGTATPSTSDDGFLWYDSNSTPAEVKFWDGAAFQAIGGGKILQVVRATDGTDRSTTSTTLVDANISVTITPTKSTSAILLVYAANAFSSSNNYCDLVITDSSNNTISGAERQVFGDGSSSSPQTPVLIMAYATPATTSAVTYKVRHRITSSGTTILKNSQATGQLFAIEVGA